MPSLENVLGFAETCGVDVAGILIESFPGIFSDRRVFRVIDDKGVDRVYKLRPISEAARAEYRSLNSLF